MKRNFNMWWVILSFLVIPTFFFQSCGDDNPLAPTSTSPQTKSFSPDVAITWYNLELKLIKQTPSLGFSPPVSSRAFGYTGIAFYESVVPGMPEYNSVAGQLNGLTTLPRISSNDVYHWTTCANAALANIVKKLFSNATAENKATIDSLEAAFNATYQTQVASDVYTRSRNFGIEISNAIYTWSSTDGGNDGQLHNTDPNYVPPVGPGLWVPTPPAFAPATQPHWGDNRPFLTQNITANQPPAPVTYSASDTSLFYAQTLEVFSTVNKLTTEQTTIARFWADGGGTYTPPGHWVAITGIALNTLGSRLDVCAAAFAKVGIAVSDAFISCWRTKYIYNVLRPITYIKNYISPTWNSLITTPSFPEYTSGHSSQSGAAAEVLSDVFGYNFNFTDNSHPELPYAPRTFNSFLEAANEAAMSRLYGGIHCRAANENGLQCGVIIGRNVNALLFLR